MRRIERDLDAVKQTRSLHRASRRRVPYPIVALVGYTNAGKSTLFNRLTSAHVFAENLLFANARSDLRAIKLPHGETSILSDTVGFISDLPTMLVAAFRATLEDVIEADVLLHVRDIAHGETEAEAADVQNVLRQLGINPDDRSRPDRGLEQGGSPRASGARAACSHRGAQPGNRAPGAGVCRDRGGDRRPPRRGRGPHREGRPSFRIVIEPTDGGASNWLHEEAEIIERQEGEGGRTEMTVRIAPEKEPRFWKRFPQAERVP
jgi:GTP-binding protein HflX